jgi:hypothetical protein
MERFHSLCMGMYRPSQAARSSNSLGEIVRG